METLHIYGQHFWHDEARIVGNKEALVLLRDAINAAIENGNGTAEVFTSDGEGYLVEIKESSYEEIKLQDLPYIDYPPNKFVFKPIESSCYCEACVIAASGGFRNRMSVCPKCHDKRCARAKHHDNECENGGVKTC